LPTSRRGIAHDTHKKQGSNRSKKHAPAADNNAEEGSGSEMHVTVGSEGFTYDEKGRCNGVATSVMLTTTASSQLAAVNDPTFEEFWALWPKGRRQGRRSAEKAWTHAIKRASCSEILDGARRHATDPNLPPLRYIPHASTWLNRDGWNDDPYPPYTNGTKGARSRDRIAAVAARHSTGVIDADSWEVGT
jgi:hypothetical protein